MTTTMFPAVGHDRPAISRPAAPPGATTTAAAVAARTLKQFWRTPQLLVVGGLTSIMFLLIFRYVFGGAIETGPVRYVDFLIPGLAAAQAMFAGAGGAVSVATDAESGLYDRLRSLPVPRSAVLVGRSLADTALVAWATFVMVAVGFATGFRFHGSLLDAVVAIALCLAYGAAFTWPFIYLGLVGGNAQAAQGLSMLIFPFVFVSSAYVPVESMPTWIRPFAEHQPVTYMVDSVRAFSLGDSGDPVFAHSPWWYAGRALLWSAVLVAVFLPLSLRRFSRQG